MVATDQNSSMIGMSKDSLKKKGHDREPTYDEIVEAKVMLARALAPHCGGILVDGYYGYWNSIASFAIPATTGVLVRVEKSGGEKKDDAKYKSRKAETVIESARMLSRWCDVYKAEFPGHLSDGDDTLAKNLKALDAASERPWVLLSAGVDFPDYKKQVELAVKH